jgi:hypothetical protein
MLNGGANQRRDPAEVFELPKLLGVAQHVEYDPQELERYRSATGLLRAEGCSRGVCIKYKVWVWSGDGKGWSASGRRRRQEDGGGCLRQQVADALWELAERGYDVGVEDCEVVVNGVRLGVITCRSVDNCVERIVQEYKYVLNAPRRDPNEEEYEDLLRRYPKLRWWNKSAVVDIIKRGGGARWALYDLLSRLADVDEKVWAFLGRFNVDLRCTVEVYSRGEELCVRFHIGNCEPRMYCYRAGEGWRAVNDTPKYIRLMPAEGGKAVEVYAIQNKEYLRVV